MMTPRGLLGCAIMFAVLSLYPIGVFASRQAKSSQIDPDALSALERMGAELRSHKLFSVKADVTTEDVLNSGQKLQYSGTLELLARRPDRFKITAVSDQRARQIFYNGSSVTVFSPRLGYYGSFHAPPTIYETVEKANADYGIELPLADLFTWGTDKSDIAEIRSAFLVDNEHIGSQTCNHYAFRQKHIDWEVWIQRDGAPLPCKLVITNRDDPSMPQYSARLRWSFPTSIADSAFTFVPSPTAHEIVFVAAGKRAGRLR